MEFRATGIQKVHVQGAQTDSDHWRYVLQWERLTRGSAEVRAACAALLQRLPMWRRVCCSAAQLPLGTIVVQLPAACGMWLR